MGSRKTTLECQLEFLKLEVETINASIRQIDEITKNIKQWAITLWTAAVGGALAKPELTKYVGLTIVIPILFWYVDSLHRSSQRRFIWRTLLIKDFLNDGRLARSIELGKVVDFDILNPAARYEEGAARDKSRKFADVRRVMRFRTVSILYIGLAALSLLIWILSATLPKVRS